MSRHLNLRSSSLRFALVLACVLALAIPALAGAKKPPDTKPGTPPGQTTKPADAQKDSAGKSKGCSGSVKTTIADGSVVNANKYALGAAVYVSGSKFPASAAFTYQVIHVQTKTVVASGAFTGKPDSSFLQLVVQNAALTGHEYKVVVSYTTASGKSCQKSDNFFFVGGVDVKGADVVLVCVATGSAKHPFKLEKVRAASLKHRHKKAGDIVPAPAAGCPTTAEVKAVETAKVPTQAQVGQPVTITVTTLPNAVVTISGAGVSQTATASPAGIVKVTVTPVKAGVVAVKGASPKPLAKFGVLGAHTSGRAFTG